MAPVLIEEAVGFRTFWLRGSCRFAACRGEIAADPQSPVAEVGLTGSRRVLWANPVSLGVAAPRGQSAQPGPGKQE